MSSVLQLRSLRRTIGLTAALSLAGMLMTVGAALAYVPLAEIPSLDNDPDNPNSSAILAPEALRDRLDPMRGVDQAAPYIRGRLTPLAPPISTTFLAVDFTIQASTSQFYVIPPDPNGAAGPVNVVDCVNDVIEIWTKTGTLQNRMRLGKNATTVVGSFFAPLTPLNNLTDPKVLYDHNTNQWIVEALEVVTSGTTVTSSRLLLAVSQTPNANGAWFYQAINTKIVIGATQYWSDYPGMGFDGQAVYLTGNMFNAAGTAFLGTRLWIVAKAGLYTGGVSVVNGPIDYYTAAGVPAGLQTTVQPAVMYGPGNAGVSEYFGSYGGLSDGVNEYCAVLTCSSPLASPTFTYQQILSGDIDNTAISSTNLNMPQSGSAIKINIGDRRTINAVWRNNVLAFAANVGAQTVADLSQCTSHWWQIDTTVPAVCTVLQQGNFGASDLGSNPWTAYAAVNLDACGNMAIGAAGSNLTIFPSSYYTGRLVGDPPGTLQSTGTLTSGVAFYVRTFTNNSTGRNRWGDYSGMALDPDGFTFWAFNQYAATQGDPTTVGTTEVGRWANSWGAFTFNCIIVPVELAYFTAERNSGTVVLNWGVSDDKDNAGFHVYRQVSGQLEKERLTSSLLPPQKDYQFVDNNPSTSSAQYWLEAVGRDGGTRMLGPAQLSEEAVRLPVTSLAPGQPNPFNSATNISYSVGTRGQIRLSVFDTQGRMVKTLVNETMDAGLHAARWDGHTDQGSQAAAGMYVIRLEGAGALKTQKVILAR